MKAVVFRKSIPRYLALRAAGRRWPGIYTSVVSPVRLRTLSAPPLPTPRWVRVRPALAGICGSDLATICAKGSAYLSPLTSTPFVLGHEVVGTVTEVGAKTDHVAPGDRVVLQPALGCRVRGIEPPCAACAAGQSALCRNVTRGDISGGIQTGYCRDTGGAWSEGFVAHPSQLFLVPDAIEDTVAVLCEPFACALHAVLRAGLDRAADDVGDAPDSRRRYADSARSAPPPATSDPQSALVMGCGSIGLLTIAAIRAIGSRARIIAMAKYPHQRDHAEALGADEVVMHAGSVRERYRRLAASLGADLHQPEIGRPTVVGGADVAFDCVASSTSIDDCCRFTRAGGRMMLVGMPGIPSGIDWTTIWYKELTVRAAYAYGQEQFNGGSRTTFDLAIELLARQSSLLRPLVGDPFSLPDWREAVRTALHAGASRSVKTTFQS
ncbi:MAG: zinc-binding dehydrogenase [Phycisphaerae bacterium]